MNYQSTPPPDKDPELWKVAQRRAAFKTSLASYFILNIFFWIIWYFTGGRTYGGVLPWPAWAMLGWGIGLFFQYMKAYVHTGSNMVNDEYDKLTHSQNK